MSLLPVLLACCAALAIAAKPHVLFVVSDDLGFSDLGFRSTDIHTPVIDGLAAKGTVLQQYYVQDVCSPSRATFMTGRFAMHHGIVDWIPPASTYGLPLNETTLADKFKQAGYVTRAVGKWHLGFYRKEMTPTFRGFESFYGFYSGGEDYFKHTSSGAYDFRRDKSSQCGPGCSQVAAEAQGQYSTQLFSAEAVHIVEQHTSDAPLFLYLAYQAVHAPAQVPSSYEQPYNSSILDPKRRTFAAMLSCMDEGIGNITRALAARGMLDDTLVVFTSDNGGPTTTGDGVGARNWPLRGGKHSIWEGGTRATALVSGHGVHPGEHWKLMHGADWLPTLSTVAGYSLQDIPLVLDGVDQWPAITAGASAPRSSFVYGNSTNDCTWAAAGQHGAWDTLDSIPCGFGIRNGSYKLVLGYGGGPDSWCNSTAHGNQCSNSSGGVPACVQSGFCLWDVEADPTEHHEISAQHPNTVQAMKAQMAAVLASYSQYKTDPQCGEPVYEQDPTVGKAWAPWC